MDAGVRDVDVEATEALDGAIHESFDVGYLAHVAWHGQDPIAAERPGGRCQAVGVAGEQCDGGPFADEQLGDAATDPRRSAGDRRDASSQPTYRFAHQCRFSGPFHGRRPRATL